MEKKIIRSIFKNAMKIPFKEIILDKETFNYTMENFNYDYDIIKKYEDFKKKFKEEFGDNKLTYYSELKEYLKKIKKCYNKLKNNIIEKKIENEDISYLKNKKDELMEGNYYLSIDLSQAFDLIIDNFANLNKPIQKIREDITNKNILSKSKGIRIMEYYDNNMDRYRDYVYIFLDEILKSKNNCLIKELIEKKCSLVNVKLDELIFDISGNENSFKKYLNIEKIKKYKVHIKIFKYHSLYYKDYVGIPHKIDIKENINGKKDYSILHCLYPNQIYKKYNNLDFNELDLRVPTSDVALEYEQKEKPIEFISSEEYKEYYNKKAI